MSKPWFVDDVAKIGVTFTVGGVATNPSTVELSVQNPAGTITTYTYASGSVSQTTVSGTPVTGSYYKNIPLTAEGTWYWRWKGTGTAAAVDEGEIVVKPSVFV